MLVEIHRDEVGIQVMNGGGWEKDRRGDAAIEQVDEKEFVYFFP
jgi:hypothetical protein